MKLVDRVYISPIDTFPTLKGPSVVRPVLNEPNRLTQLNNHNVCIPQVPVWWGAKPIPYWHNNRVAFEWPYDSIVPLLETFVSNLIKRYGDDPLCVGIEMGVFGQWGEWTTYRHRQDRFPNAKDGYRLYSDETVRRMFGAVRDANPSKPVFARTLGGILGDTTSITIGHELTRNAYEDVFGHPNAEIIWNNDAKYRNKESLYGAELHADVQRELLRNPSSVFARLLEKNVYYVCRPYVKPSNSTEEANLKRFYSMLAYSEEQK